jgi:hypothetical protein
MTLIWDYWARKEMQAHDGYWERVGLLGWLPAGVTAKVN